MEILRCDIILSWTVFALYSWLTIPTGTHVPLFCDYRTISAGITSNHSYALGVFNYTEFMRMILSHIGIG